MEEGSKRAHGAEKEVELPARKKGKKGSARGNNVQESVEVPPTQYVRVVPVRPRTAEDDVQDQVLLSKVEKAAGLQLSADRLSVTGEKGFRTVRATHGYHVGTYYCEVTIQQLGPSGHCRIGWTTKKSELHAPVGYDQYGVGYRDLEGSKVHKALREDYGEPYGEGDVIGLFIHLPEGGRPLELRTAELVRYKGHLYQRAEDEPEPKVLAGSLVGFSKNGLWQGVAYRDFLEGTYYPSVSLYTMPDQLATVQFNFGPEFKFPAPTVEACPAAEAVSVLPGKWAADEATAAGVPSATSSAAAPKADGAAAGGVGTAAAAAGPGAVEANGMPVNGTAAADGISAAADVAAAAAADAEGPQPVAAAPAEPTADG